MAISKVSIGAANVLGAVGTNQPSFGQATTAGNLLVAWVCVPGSSSVVTTCNDSNWLLAAGGGEAGITGDIMTLWYRPNCGASETAPTFAHSGSTQAFIARLGEFSGADTSSVLGHAASGESATSPVTITMSGADSVSGCLVLSVGYTNLSMSGTHTSSDTYNNGATQTDVASNDGTSTQNHYTFAWGLTTGNSAAQNDAFASNSMSLFSIWSALATFLPASAGPTNVVFAQPTNFQDPGLF